MEQIKITIPRVHPSINEWKDWHWAKTGRVKKSFESDIGWLAGKYNEPMLENCDVEIIYYFDNKIRHDKDNYVPKFILDGLVKAGIIKDDNDGNIFLNWKLILGHDERKTEIIVTPR